MSWAQRRIGRMLARYLEKPATGYEPFTPSNPDALARSLKPGDVLLVEGNNHVAGVIKYLTQSTWSHAALCVGPVMGKSSTRTKAHVLIEAVRSAKGVISAPLSKYFKFHTRVCRPVGLVPEDLDKVCRYAIDRIGLDYDLKNIIDLLRYLMPLPIPQRWRRRMIALGSGDPTRIICSALIAQAFESVRYPILPRVTQMESRQARRDILEIRHSSLYAPRDFDISPYFEVVKPTIVGGFKLRRPCTGPTGRCRPTMWRDGARFARWRPQRPVEKNDPANARTGPPSASSPGGGAGRPTGRAPMEDTNSKPRRPECPS